MSVTSAPIGSTGQSLDGFGVNANVPDAFRESVVLTDPTDPLAVVSIVNTQPIGFYGVPVWLQGTPSVGIAGQVSVQGSTYVLNPSVDSGSTFVTNPPTSTFVTNPVSSTFTRGTSQVFGTVSTQIVSSIPILVSQSTNPWVVTGTTQVSNQLTTTSVNVLTMPALSGTTMVNIVSTGILPVSVVSTVATPVNVTTQVTVNASSYPLGTTQVFGQVSTFPTGVTSSFVVNAAGTGVTSTQIISSIPFFVSQSSAPWTFNGAVNISSQTGVSSSWPLSTTLVNVVSSLPLLITGTTMVNIVSTTPQAIFGGINISSQTAVSSSWPLSTTMVYVVSTVPSAVVQSSGPWTFVETATSTSNLQATSFVLLATLNTTVVKTGQSALYGYQISNFASTSLFVKFANASTAGAASTAPYLKRVGVAPSTTVFGGLDLGVNFSTGIVMYTTREAFNTGLTAPLGSTAVVNLLYA